MGQENSFRSHRCGLTQQFCAHLWNGSFSVSVLPSVGPDSTYNCLFCGQKVVTSSIQGYLLSYLHCMWIKGSFVGTVSEGASFLSRSPQQMSLYDSLIQTEFLDLTALCSVVRFAGYFWPIIVGLVTESVPSLTPGWNMTTVMAGRKDWELLMKGDWRMTLEANNWPQWLRFSFSGSKWSPLPLILLTDLLW